MKSRDLDDIGRACRTHVGKRCEGTIILGKFHDKRSLFRSWCRLEGNIKMDLEERAWTGFI
jgi:hypothetical protein